MSHLIASCLTVGPIYVILQLAIRGGINSLNKMTDIESLNPLYNMIFDYLT